MIVSRVFPTLIKLNHVIKLNTIPKSHILNPSGHSIIKNCTGILNKLKVKTMSTDVNDLNNPKRHFDYYQLITKKDEGNVVIIDVREHSEINETGKIPGSIHIPLNDLNQALNAISNEEFLELYKSRKPKVDDKIIFTCRSGRRSLIAMRSAFELGYTEAGNYKGGWLDWAEKTGLSK